MNEILVYLRATPRKPRPLTQILLREARSVQARRMPIVLADEYVPGPADFGVVLTLFERADIVAKVLDGLYATVIGRWELAITVDLGRDNTTEAAMTAVRAQPRPECTSGALLQRVLVYSSRTALYETAAENVGMRLLQPALAYVLLQADVSLNEVGWNAVLASALMSSNVTVWAVTARCAIPSAKYSNDHAISHQRGGNKCGGFERIRRDEVPAEQQRTAYVGHHVTRGPLLVNAAAMGALGYWPEDCGFQGTEESLLMTRARLAFGWQVALHTCMYAHACTCMHAYTCMHAHACIHTHAHACTYTYTQSAYLFADIHQEKHRHQGGPKAAFDLSDRRKAFPAAAYVGEALPWCRLPVNETVTRWPQLPLGEQGAGYRPLEMRSLVSRSACDPAGLSVFSAAARAAVSVAGYRVHGTARAAASAAHAPPGLNAAGYRVQGMAGRPAPRPSTQGTGYRVQSPPHPNAQSLPPREGRLHSRQAERLHRTERLHSRQPERLHSRQPDAQLPDGGGEDACGGIKSLHRRRQCQTETKGPLTKTKGGITEIDRATGRARGNATEHATEAA